jgi:hypothetical protein
MITEKLFKQSVQSIIDLEKTSHELYKTTDGAINLLEVSSLASLVDTFERLIEYCVEDVEDSKIGSELSYFLYELDGGKNWTPESFEVEEEPVDISSVDKLWEYYRDYNHIEDRRED